MTPSPLIARFRSVRGRYAITPDVVREAAIGRIRLRCYLTTAGRATLDSDKGRRPLLGDVIDATRGKVTVDLDPVAFDPVTGRSAA